MARVPGGPKQWPEAVVAQRLIELFPNQVLYIELLNPKGVKYVAMYGRIATPNMRACNDA
jgi:hypothetical protein